jgi:hypothetical protein
MAAIKAFNTKYRVIILFSVKILLFIFTVHYLYKYVWQSDSLSQLFPALKNALHSNKKIFFLLVSVVLIFVNWGFEALKWQKLIHKFTDVSLSNAFKAILAGTSMGFWIPNRTGEYLGRLVFVAPEHRINTVLATFIGSASQLLITLLAGSAGLIYYLYFQVESRFILLGAGMISTAFAVVSVIIFLNFNRVKHLLPRIKFVNSFRKYAGVYSLYSPIDLAEILIISGLRYLVFCSQFLFLLYVFGVEINWVNAFFMILLTYLVQTAVPTTALTELGVRGAVSLYFFNLFTADIAGVLAASYALWLINLIIPGCVGLVFLMLAKGKKFGVCKEEIRVIVQKG